MTEPLDMMMLARFAVLPGAAELIRAFSEIPPGPLRDSVIQHARVIAATYTGAPAQHRMPDPLGAFAVAPQLTSRTGRPPKSEGPEAEAIKMRIAGSSISEIAEATGLATHQIYKTLAAARKAGLKVPGKKDRELHGAAAKVWHTSLDTLTGQGRSITAAAAAKRGITPQAYIDRRQLVLKLAMEGASYERILKESGETDQKVVSAWLSAARGAGYNVPYTTFLSDADLAPKVTPQAEPEPAQDAVAAPTGRVFRDISEMAKPAAAAVRHAAEKRNITVEAYQEIRESIVRLRMEGKTPSLIAAMTAQSSYFVKDTIDAAKVLGVMFPAFQADEVTAPALAETPALKDAG